jgi:sec-independent protein translocase protein TatA
MSLGITEIILIVLAIVILFGGKKIPELARALGRASHEFKKAKQTIENEVNEIRETSEKETKEPLKAADVKESPENK